MEAWVPHATCYFPWILSFNPHSLPIKWWWWPLNGLDSAIRTILSGSLCPPAASALSLLEGAGSLPPDAHRQLWTHSVPAQLPQRKTDSLFLFPHRRTLVVYALCSPLDPWWWPRGWSKIFKQGLRVLWLEVPPELKHYRVRRNRQRKERKDGLVNRSKGFMTGRSGSCPTLQRTTVRIREDQRGQVTCPRSHIPGKLKPGHKARQSDKSS